MESVRKRWIQMGRCSDGNELLLVMNGIDEIGDGSDANVGAGPIADVGSR